MAKIEIHIGNRKFLFLIDWKKIKDEVYGWTNRTMDGKYLIVLDYDKMELEWIEPEIRELQRLYYLSDFLIFTSNKGYHAICFDKLPLQLYTQILRDSSVDPAYASVPLMYGKRNWTLRWSEKKGKRPHYTKTIASKNSLYDKSKAHIIFIEKMYKMEVQNKNNIDSNSKLILSKYWI